MKKNKKNLLILILMTFIALTFKVSADEGTYEIKLSASNNSIEIGDKTTLTIELITSIDADCTLDLSYDTSKLELEKGSGTSQYSQSSILIRKNGSQTKTATLTFVAIASGGTDIKIGPVSCGTTSMQGTPASIKINTKGPDLSAINLTNATLSPAFDPNITEYTASMTAEITTINGVLADSNMKLTGNGDYSLNVDETKNVNLVVTSKNGKQKTYKIKLTRPKDLNKSNNNYLEYISFNGEKIDFNKDNLVYEISVKYDVENADIKFKTEDEKATANLTGPDKLEVGDNVYKISVTAENGDLKEYTLTVTRQKEKNTVEYNEEKILEEIENGEEEEIYVEVPEDEKIKTVDKSILQKLKEYEKTITYEVTNDDNELLYSITVDGKKIKDADKVLNFNMTFKSDFKSFINALTNKKDVIYLNFESNSKLPGNIIVKVFVGDKFKNGKTLYLYYYNEKDNKLEKQSKKLKVKNGYVEFELEHFSEYVLSDTDFTAIKEEKSNNLKYIVPIIAGISVVVIGLVIFFIVKKKKKGNNDSKPKKEKKSKKKNTTSKTASTPEENQDLEKTIPIDTQSINEQQSQNNSEENQEEKSTKEVEPEKEENKEEELEIIDLDDTDSNK